MGNYLLPMIVYLGAWARSIIWRVRRFHIYRYLRGFVFAIRLAFLRSWITGKVPGSRKSHRSPGPMYQLFIFFFMITDPKTNRAFQSGGQCIVRLQSSPLVRK